LTAADLIIAISEADVESLPAIAMALAARMAATRPAPLPPPAAAEQWLTPAQVGTELGYSTPYVYELLKRGELPHVKDRKLIRIRRSAVDEYLASREMRGPLPEKVAKSMRVKA
jgi:excisionase family DNA binding protein